MFSVVLEHIQPWELASSCRHQLRTLWAGLWTVALTFRRSFARPLLNGTRDACYVKHLTDRLLEDGTGMGRTSTEVYISP